jgi:hypothetical protein
MNTPFLSMSSLISLSAFQSLSVLFIIFLATRKSMRKTREAIKLRCSAMMRYVTVSLPVKFLPAQTYKNRECITCINSTRVCMQVLLAVLEK